MKSIFLILLVAFACYGIWFIATLSNCKKNNVPVKDKLAELWNEPFWIGPEKLEKTRNIMFFVVGFAIFAFYLFYNLMTYSHLSEILPFFSNIVLTSRFNLFLLLLLTLFLVKHSLKQRLCIGVIELYFFADIFIIEKNIWENTCSIFIPVLILLIIANELKIERVFKAVFILTIACFAVTAFLSALGVIGSGDCTTLESRFSESGWLDMRYALGFSHPNTAGMILAVIIAMWFIIRSEKIKWWDWIICAVGAVVITVVIDSRGGLLFLVAFVVSFIIFKKFPKLYNLQALKYPAFLSPAILAGITFLCAVFYNGDNAIWQKLNKISTGRLSLIQINFNNFKFTLFGQITERWDAPCVDNAYLNTYIQRGIVALIIVILLYCILIKRLWNKQATPELALVFAYMVYYCIEGGILSIVLNISLYLLASIILLEPESKQQLFHSETKAVKQLSSIKK